jgi:nitrogen fixation protein
MAISFNKQKGSAQKSNMESFAFKDGENKMRIVGDILARYVYWIEGENGKNLPLECLSFDRDAERFNNSEKDWVREYYPDLKCGWSYATQCIDPNDGKLKIVNLKKKLWEQIVQTAQDGLGDPTDIENGWDICFKRVKTGPLPYNVEYQLQVLKCKNRPLSTEELSTIAELKSMDDVMPRPTPDAQKELLDRLRTGSKDNDDEMLEEEFKVG